ncbi:MAG: nucleotidyltransferase domain-containing protein [Bacteroidia bacterium]|nr:nucleotidyltransferase domain-containing protein [Bacteroidia bacterium]
MDRNLSALVKDRRHALQQLIQLKSGSVIEQIVLLFAPHRILHKRALQFFERHKSLNVDQANHAHLISVQPYTGQNATAIQLKDLVLSQLKDDIEDILIHGSVADETTCSYSDFDCLIILKDEVSESVQRIKRVAYKLWKWQRLLLLTDILQHHGWFIAFKSDLKYWDQTYLPAEVFRKAKSLLKHETFILPMFTDHTEDFKQPFLKLCNELLSVTPPIIKRSNSYELKSFISRFFLMPALYYQARYGQGIYKRDSFELARQDFQQDMWESVQSLSKLRLSWKQDYSQVTSKLITAFYLWPSSLRKHLYPTVDAKTKKTVLDELPGIHRLLEAMKKNILQSDF